MLEDADRRERRGSRASFNSREDMLENAERRERRASRASRDSLEDMRAAVAADAEVVDEDPRAAGRTLPGAVDAARRVRSMPPPQRAGVRPRGDTRSSAGLHGRRDVGPTEDEL